MKKLLVIFALIFLFIQPVSAHGPGEPPFFKINEKYADYYQVPLTASAFTLPQDGAPETYLVNTPITFAIDTEKVVIPPEIVQQAEFSWDFGDGTEGSGLENTHIYTTPGSYFLEIYMTTSIAGEEQKQLFQTTLFHVLPNAEYKLPLSVISVDGKKSKDPIIDTIDVSFDKEIRFSAADSQSQANIKEYIWDFGDGTSAKGKEVTHTYDVGNTPMTIAFVTLRIVTEDGFIADSFVQLNNTQNSIEDPISQKQRQSVFPYLIGTSIVGIILIIFLIKTLRKKL